ncbi:MAG: diacylglycerol kinase catalytic subunit [Cyanobacteria bacterium RYN_339]|nr:diacylglycerol kinase catalytic subunit [Cyanobacteria bacterium RYN_339]
MMTTQTELPPFEVDLRRTPGAAKTAYVVYNAAAGGSRQKVEIEDVRKRFLANGWSVATIATRCAGDGTEAARHAMGLGADVVVAMGGDGTVNEVAQALAKTAMPLGIVPIGTVNVLVRELGLSLDAMEAVDIIATGEPLAIDLGTVNGRYFTMMSSLGYDAASAFAMIPTVKQWSGQLAYWIGAVQSFGKHRAVRAKIVLEDGKRKKRLRRLIYMMVISNTQLYGDGALKFTPQANVRDGLLDICLIRSARWYRALLHIVLSFTGKIGSVSDVETFRTRRITITTSRPFPYQIDGDPVGHTPVVIEVAPLGLHVMVRPGNQPRV